MTQKNEVFAFTAGKPLRRSQRTIVFIHGAGHDHSVWQFPVRHFARHGVNAIAPDLPGHGRSGGKTLASIEAMAEWLLDWLPTISDTAVTLVGHSMGSLIALRAAAIAPERIEQLVLVGSAVPMPVAAPLLEASRDNPAAAYGMINRWSFAHRHQLGASAMPGFHLPGLNLRMMARVGGKALHTDLSACNAYLTGLEDAARIRCKTTLICGEHDHMTPRNTMTSLQSALANASIGAHIIVLPDCGHAMMTEAPAALLDALRELLATE